MHKLAVPPSMPLNSGAGIVGCLFLDTCFGQAKEVCQTASKGNLMDN